MSSVLSRLKAINEIETLDERLAAIMATLPRRFQCKFIDADGIMCQERRTGPSWCDACRQRVAADPERSKRMQRVRTNV
jgi:hypothetical protein